VFSICLALNRILQWVILVNKKSLLIANSLIVLAMLALSAWAWRQVPDTQLIPVHYGIDGTPDRYGGKFEGLLAMPLIGVGLTVLFAILPYIEPRAENLMRSHKAYCVTLLSGLGLLLALHAGTVLQALGWRINVAMIASVGSSVLIAIVGNYLGKVRSNFSFGIRTPWTLSSEQSWNKTHRLGGRLLFFLGISGAIAALANANQLFILLILGGTISLTVILVIYSYLVWKDDPERRSIKR
jgi:uncharacterized membrane protein